MSRCLSPSPSPSICSHEPFWGTFVHAFYIDGFVCSVAGKLPAHREYHMIWKLWSQAEVGEAEIHILIRKSLALSREKVTLVGLLYFPWEWRTLKKSFQQNFPGYLSILVSDQSLSARRQDWGPELSGPHALAYWRPGGHSGKGTLREAKVWGGSQGAACRAHCRQHRWRHRLEGPANSLPHISIPSGPEPDINHKKISWLLFHLCTCWETYGHILQIDTQMDSSKLTVKRTALLKVSGHRRKPGEWVEVKGV